MAMAAHPAPDDPKRSLLQEPYHEMKLIMGTERDCTPGRDETANGIMRASCPGERSVPNARMSASCELSGLQIRLDRLSLGEPLVLLCKKMPSLVQKPSQFDP
ncbi:unnamed protein product [Brassica oleracea]